MRPSLARSLASAALAVALASPATAHAASAQIFPDDVVDEARFAYIAISSTPLGLLPSPFNSAMLGIGQRIGVHGSFGTVENLKGFGISVDFPAGRTASAGLTGGIGTCENDRCDTRYMLGGSVKVLLAARPMSAAASAARLHLGLDVSTGFARLANENDNRDDITAFSFGAGVPISILTSPGTGGVSFVPYLTPGFAYGRLSDDDGSESGVRAMIGGGIGIVASESGLALSFGFKNVFYENGEPQFGVLFSWFPRRTL